MTTSYVGEHSGRAPTKAAGQRRAASVGTLTRVLARRIHFLAGVVVAPFLVMLCLTGLVYVFSPQIHHGLYHSQLYVDKVTGTPRPLSQQVASALRAHPEATLVSVMPPPGPDRTTRVVLSVPGLVSTGKAVRARSVYVDPYTNYINGELTTLDDQLPANTWLRVLHGSFHLGSAGRFYSELAASWLPFIVVGGVVLWFGAPGRKRRLREVLVPSVRGKGPRVRLRAVKGPVGLWLALGLLTVGITGLSMSQLAGGRSDQAVDPLDARRPILTAAPVDVPNDTRMIGLDRAVAVATAEGLGGELVVTTPASDDEPFTVVENGMGLPIERDAIALDPYTAKVTERIEWRDWPLLSKLATLGVEFHTGALFGLANRVVMAVLAIGTLVLIVLSYAMWWKRSPYGRRWASLPPPAWRQLRPGVLVLIVAAVAMLGWVLPVFGVSLVGFVVVDAMINALRRRQAILPPAREPAAMQLVRRIRVHRAAAMAFAAVTGCGVLMVLLLWPFGSRLSPPALHTPTTHAQAPMTTPTPTEPATTPARTPRPSPMPSRGEVEPVLDNTPFPTTRPGGDPRHPGPGKMPRPVPTQQPTGNPTQQPPTSSPNPSPTIPPPTPTPNPPPPDDGTTCTIRIGDSCLIDLGWLL